MSVPMQCGLIEAESPVCRDCGKLRRFCKCDYEEREQAYNWQRLLDDDPEYQHWLNSIGDTHG